MACSCVSLQVEKGTVIAPMYPSRPNFCCIIALTMVGKHRVEDTKKVSFPFPSFYLTNNVLNLILLMWKIRSILSNIWGDDYIAFQIYSIKWGRSICLMLKVFLLSWPPTHRWISQNNFSSYPSGNYFNVLQTKIRKLCSTCIFPDWCLQGPKTRSKYLWGLNLQVLEKSKLHM